MQTLVSNNWGGARCRGGEDTDIMFTTINLHVKGLILGASTLEKALPNHYSRSDMSLIAIPTGISWSKTKNLHVL